MPRSNLIKLRTGSDLPNPADFEIGEPAWDSLTGKLYIKASGGLMIEINKELNNVYTANGVIGSLGSPISREVQLFGESSFQIRAFGGTETNWVRAGSSENRLELVESIRVYPGTGFFTSLPIKVHDGSGWYSILVGPPGSGPGGEGRMLYLSEDPDPDEDGNPSTTTTTTTTTTTSSGTTSSTTTSSTTTSSLPFEEPPFDP